jgi:hypothetical protein
MLISASGLAASLTPKRMQFSDEETIWLFVREKPEV